MAENTHTVTVQTMHKISKRTNEVERLCRVTPKRIQCHGLVFDRATGREICRAGREICRDSWMLSYRTTLLLDTLKPITA